MSISSRNEEQKMPHNPLSLDDEDTLMAEASSSSSSLTSDNPEPVVSVIELHQLLTCIPPIPQNVSFANLPAFFKQATIYLALQSEFLLPNDLAALTSTSRLGKYFFKKAFNRQATLQPLLDAASHSDKNKIKDIIKKDRSMTLFSQSGYTISPAGKSLSGNALEILMGAIDENIPRDKGIAHDKCELLLLTGTRPIKQHLPAGEFRAYIFFRQTASSNPSELYFAERMLAGHQDGDVILERLDFLPDKNPLALFNTLSPEFDAIYGLSGQIILLKPNLTPDDLTLITAFTDYTHEEGLRETVERHLRTVPTGPAIISAAEKKQYPPGWEKAFKIQQEKNSQALKTIIRVLEEATDHEVRHADDVDIAIQKILHNRVQGNYDIILLKKLIHDICKATSNTFDEAYDKLINYLQLVSVIGAGFNSQLLKAIFKFRNHLKPSGIIRFGKHFDHDLLAEAVKLYHEKYLKFCSYKDDPMAVKNQFSVQKIFGYILRGVSAADAQTVRQGLLNIFDHCAKLKRTYSLFPLDSDPTWYPGYNCAWRHIRSELCWSPRLFQNFVRQKTSARPHLGGSSTLGDHGLNMHYSGNEAAAKACVPITTQY